MPTAEEFQQYLRESLEAAANATTEAERKAFLQMARTWSEAAGVAGLSVAPIEPKSDPCARD
jgi:hypothetical protein